MYGQELGSMVESVIHKLEDKAYQPPRICWNGGAIKLGDVGFSVFEIGSGAGLYRCGAA